MYFLRDGYLGRYLFEIPFGGWFSGSESTNLEREFGISSTWATIQERTGFWPRSENMEVTVLAFLSSLYMLRIIVPSGFLCRKRKSIYL